jgi:hypothetical protein
VLGLLTLAVIKAVSEGAKSVSSTIMTTKRKSGGNMKRYKKSKAQKRVRRFIGLVLMAVHYVLETTWNVGVGAMAAHLSPEVAN